MAAVGLGESNTGKVYLRLFLNQRQGIGATLVIHRGYSVNLAGGVFSMSSAITVDS